MTNGEWIYVNRQDYMPDRMRMEGIINKVHVILRPKGLTFQSQLIGSGNRNMVTTQIGSNTGYDFDYNLELQYVPKDCSAKQIKDLIRDAFREALAGSKYNDPEDSTSVLTIKLTDTKKKIIVHSFDFAIIYHDDEGNVHYLHHDKNRGSYGFQNRGYRFDEREYVQEIKDFYVDGWGLIRDEYLKLKNSNGDSTKHSYNLYVEAVKNVHNQMIGRPDYLRTISFI